MSIKGSQKTDEKANKKLNAIPLLDAVQDNPSSHFVGDQIEARFRPLLCFDGGRRNIVSLSWRVLFFSNVVQAFFQAFFYYR